MADDESEDGKLIARGKAIVLAVIAGSMGSMFGVLHLMWLMNEWRDGEASVLTGVFVSMFMALVTFLLYRGVSWARWVMFVLALIVVDMFGTMWGIMLGMPSMYHSYFELTLPSVFVFILGLMWALTLSKSVKAFLAQQRAERQSSVSGHE
jgi:hypothetical protein